MSSWQPRGQPVWRLVENCMARPSEMPETLTTCPFSHAHTTAPASSLSCHGGPDYTEKTPMLNAKLISFGASLSKPLKAFPLSRKADPLLLGSQGTNPRPQHPSPSLPPDSSHLPVPGATFNLLSISVEFRKQTFKTVVPVLWVQRARQESVQLPEAAIHRQNSKAALKVMQINTDMIITLQLWLVILI